MPEWKFPVDLPRFEDDKLTRLRAEYVAKNGYYVSPPRLKDVIKIRFHKEPDPEEFDRWKIRSRSEYLLGKYPMSKSVPKWTAEAEEAITSSRFYEIQDNINSKRERFERYKASPAPTWLRNAGSVLTFMDDVNDMAGTAAVVCRIAARFAPRVLTKFFLGPAGWLLLVADLFSLLQTLWMLPLTCIAGKRNFESVGDLNPFSKNAKARRASKLRRVMPGKGEIIEALQTTDQLFGIGLSLGPVVGFAQDIVAGTVRTARGEKVTWKSPPPAPRSAESNAMRCLRFAQVVGLARDVMTEDEHWLMMIALNGATQILKPYFKNWQPLDQVNGLENVLFQAPAPQHPTTKYLLEEFGIQEGQAQGWPGLDKSEATADELWDYYQPESSKSFMDFCIRNRRNQLGSTGAQNAYEFSKNMLLLTEGYETVDETFAPGWDGWHRFMAGGCRFDKCDSEWGGFYWWYRPFYYRIGNSDVQIICVIHLYINIITHQEVKHIPPYYARCGDCDVIFSDDW